MGNFLPCPKNKKTFSDAETKKIDEPTPQPVKQTDENPPTGSQTEKKPQTGASTPSESQTEMKPPTGTSTPSESQAEMKPQTGTSTPSEPQKEIKPQTGTSTPSESHTGMKPQTGTSTPPESQAEMKPQTGTSTSSESQAEMKPQTGTSTPSESQAEMKPQTGASTPSESPMEVKPQTGTSTPSESHTGMKPQTGTSTPPESQAEMKPQTGTSTSSESQAEMKPQTGTSTPSESQAEMKPQTGTSTPSESQTEMKPKTGTSPSSESQTEMKPQTGTSTPSESQMEMKPQTGTSTPSEPQMEMKPQTGTSTPSESYTEMKPQTGTSTPSESQTEMKPQTGTSTPSESQMEMKPQTGTSTPSESQMEMKPQTGASTPSESQMEMKPQTGTSTPSESQMEMKPQTGASTPSESQMEMKPQTGTSTPSESQMEMKPQTGASTPSESQMEMKPQTGATSPTKTQTDHKPEADSNVSSESKIEKKPHIESNVSSEAQTETKPQMEKSASQDQGHTQNNRKIETSPRAVIFSVEKDDDMKSLENWTRNIIPDCQLINPTTIEDWKSVVEDSAIVIVYTTSSSYERFMEKMGEYMDHWKGYEKVIVVVGDIQTSENEVRSEWDGGRCPQWELHLFTKTELQWIREDPRMQEMSSKIQKIRDIVLRDYQEDITLKGKQKFHVKLVSMSDNLKNQKKESKKQAQKRGSVNDNLNRDPPQKEARWLEMLLRDDEMLDFTFCHISEIKNVLPKEETSLTCILLFTKETFQKIITEKKNSDQQYIKKLKGQTNLTVVVVVHDLDDESSEKDLEDKYKKSEYKDLWKLFLFRREEQGPEYQDYISAEATAEEKWRKFKESIKTKATVHKSGDTADATRPPTDNEKDTRTPGHLGIVGIFSRSSITDYSWIEKELTSPDLSPVVSGVRPFYISNNQIGTFYKELGLCSFGILYHTKNRGRVNVTNVTDSLYDEELAAMSLILRRENVIVVIDDLSSSILEEKKRIQEKERILETQPSIDDYAFDLLLFSEQEKKDGEHKERLRQAIISLAAGKKTEGTRNSRKNQPEIKEKNTGNQDDQSNNEKTASMCSSL
ncbi:uncharacterized protein [Ranitomeya imitator]|uniref:uncharacterized protein isoform X2 n=1 Tax=Ranitomeya imitator TaxID=111125 RepID=UPI0037E8EE2E